MSTAERSDVAILGAGIAGLSLASRLISSDAGLSVSLIGPRDVRNQRISFWMGVADVMAYQAFIQHKWQTWEFNHCRTGVVSHRAIENTYVSLDAKKYKAHLEAQTAHPCLNRIEARASDVRVTAVGCDILLESGTVSAGVVIDTRPPRIPAATLKQQFWGTTIDLSRAHGISAPLLMDFDVSRIAGNGVTFVYVLPLSASQLLVEATTFSTSLQSERAYQQCVRQWIRDNLAMVPDIDDEHSEAGVLPMGPVLPIEPWLANCGLAGGAARASTGYAFAGTERQASRLVAQLLAGATPDTQSPYSARANWMDEVFLNVAKRQPARLVDLFMTMAQHLSGDDFAHFLSDTGGWKPCFRTVAVAPKWPFLKAAAQTLLSRKWT